MVYRSADQQMAAIMNRQNGKKLAKDALEKGNYALAWKHAQAYNLDVYDIMQLGLPMKHKPRGFNPKTPQAEGCVG